MNIPLRFKAGKKGLEVFFLPWQVEVLNYLWSIYPEDANSREVYENVVKRLDKTVSRTSIINYLNEMVDERLILYTESTGKGGVHWRYKIKFSKSEFKEYLVRRVMDKLLSEYPEATKKAIKQV